MNRSPHNLTRNGYTLVELIVSLSAASVLMVGLSSSMFIAVRTTELSNTPTEAAVNGHHLLNNICAELPYALTISEQTATAITVTVPDRADAGTAPETIRYAWSGTAGDPLTRQYNGGANSNVATDVHSFDVQYYQPVTAVEYVTIRLQVSDDSQAHVETAIPLVNRP